MCVCVGSLGVYLVHNFCGIILVETRGLAWVRVRVGVRCLSGEGERERVRVRVWVGVRARARVRARVSEAGERGGEG